MAFPKLLQRLFQNNGAGDKLNQDIIPDIPYSKITDVPSITVDSALSSTSENPVQNKVINAALDSVSTKADNSGYQVGDIKLYAGSDVPDGWFRCDGSTIADMATNYPKLYAVLGTNVLPNSSGMCLQGAVSGIGTNVSAGLPNITGTVATNSQYFSSNDSKSSGALRQAAFYGARNQYRADDSSANYISFDASLSNSIYGSSSTVQPAALKVAVLIKHD